ncbi:MAG TPA: UDP-N-acetylmuramoyl-L-alanyl-D-glutamate--2,6-diaminopimelate ligase [Anaeromyxobacteraceae bacterium]|nr:UDP-N-acetylmuramoyl-L-alanyl-D-glutamate--2,6-diaminopimelate ligase [Anaeromyxobacteraceae bacterium]
MRLSTVIAGTGASLGQAPDAEVSRVTADSRKVNTGTLFVAVPGTRADGADFAPAAARAGAVAVLAERALDCPPAPVLLVPSARRALALAAANLHGRPGDRLALCGVTGTKGKTTVTWLVEACATAAGVPAGVVGTVGVRLPGRMLPATHTTPDAAELQSHLAEMVAAGVRVAALEVSSHALDQERVAGLSFRAAGFTNLGRDHLDYHADEAAYLAAKRRLFDERLAPDGVAVVNAADPAGARVAASLAAAGRTVWRTGVPGAEITARDVETGLSGTRAVLDTPRGELRIASPLVGAHNLENLLVAAGLALGLGLPPEAVAAGLSASRGAPGRLERIDGRGVSAFVDYAHTPDSLAAACAAIRALSPRRLVVLFGCGGDRDRGKRPLLGRAAGAAADLVVVTSDNPRTEDPAAILAAIVPGVESAGLSRLSKESALAGARGFVVEEDRRAAIALALAAARPGDAVLHAGKGHEDYQIVGTEKRHLDDREEARRALGAA